jgi:putative membrane-bound dehydrogenase-like protein
MNAALRSTLVPCLIVFLGGATRAADPIELKQAESARRPQPAWVRMVDLGEQEPALKGYQAPAGVRVQVVADEKLMLWPAAMRFDEDGSLLVIRWGGGANIRQEKVTYKDGSSRTLPRWSKEQFDVMQRLRDTDGDGVFDQADVVLDDLQMPPSLLVKDGWLYLTTRGSVVRRKLPGPGRTAAAPEPLVIGLSGWKEHQSSGLTRSLDDWLYVTSGDEDSYAEGSDGSRLTLLRNGGVWRVRPDGSNLSLFARGFRNPYRDVVLDDFNNMFHVDNDNEDGSKFMGVRLFHIQEEADYGWRLATSVSCCSPDNLVATAWGEAPGRMPGVVKTGRGGPAGMAIYDSDRFPDFFRGLLIYPDMFQKNVRCYRVERKGSTFDVVEQFTLLESKNDSLFKPVQAVVGPDGTIYLADLRSDGPGRQAGRIWRLTWAGTAENPALIPHAASRWSTIRQSSDDELLLLLDRPELEIRLRSLDELDRRGEKTRARVAELAKASKSPRTRASCLLGASRAWNEAVEALAVQMLRDESMEVRRVAADVLSREVGQPLTEARRQRVDAALRLALRDEQPAVRRSAALALASVERHAGRTKDSTADIIWQQLRQERDSDRFVIDGLLRAIERTGDLAPLREAVLQAADAVDRGFAIDLVAALRIPEADALFHELLSKNICTEEESRRLLIAYRMLPHDPKVTTDHLAGWIATHPDAPAGLLEEAIKSLSAMAFNNAEVVDKQMPQFLTHRQRAVRLAAIRVIEQQRFLSAARPLVNALLNEARDEEEQRLALKALAALRPRGAFAQRISEKGVDGCIDDLARFYSAAPESVRPEALTLLGMLDFGRARPLAEKALETADPQTISAALNVLAGDTAAVKMLGERLLDGTLGREHLASVNAAIERHMPRDKSGDLAKLRERILKTALLPSNDPAELKRLEALVESTGNADRGKKVLLDVAKSQCLRCHGLEGNGGKIGPDLTGLHKNMTTGKWLESILDPSREIKANFETYVLVTTGGQVYSGLKIVDDGKRYVLRDAQGRDLTIPRDDVEELVPGKTSIMPEGLAANLSLQELLDLTAFLKDGEAQKTLPRPKTVAP